jgi:hypothetical protein
MTGSVLLLLVSHKSNGVEWVRTFGKRILLGEGRAGAKVGEFHSA